MKFLKGMMLGGIVSAGVLMMINDNMGNNNLKKKGKKIAKKIENMMW